MRRRVLALLLACLAAVGCGAGSGATEGPPGEEIPEACANRRFPIVEGVPRTAEVSSEVAGRRASVRVTLPDGAAERWLRVSTEDPRSGEAHAGDEIPRSEVEPSTVEHRDPLTGARYPVVSATWTEDGQTWVAVARGVSGDELTTLLDGVRSGTRADHRAFEEAHGLPPTCP